MGRATSFRYDLSGRLVEMTDGRGLLTEYAYDSAGQMLSRKTQEGEDLYTYDSTGMVTRSANSSLVVEKRYDSRDRLVEVRYPALGNAFRHEYDLAGRLIRTVYPKGEVGEYGYDAAGRVTGASEGTGKGLSLSYDPGGRRTKQSWSNGVSTRWALTLRTAC